jgi:catechol 2,3-dioxygenase-like lactoylglutathione lyase family enzyme
VNDLKSTVRELEHIGIMVQNLEEAIDYYSQTLGIKKFRIFESDRKLGASDKDTGSSKQRVALGKAGNIIIELIQTLEGSNRFQELADKRGEYIHLGFTVGNLEEELERVKSQAVRVIASAKNNLSDGGSSALLGAQEPGGLLIQLLQVNKSLIERVQAEDKEITL